MARRMRTPAFVEREKCLDVNNARNGIKYAMGDHFLGEYHRRRTTLLNC